MPRGIILQEEICLRELDLCLRPDYAQRMKGDVLARNVRALRAHLGLNQTAFADRVGSGQANVSKWERGTTPETAPLEAMAQLAGCSISEFKSREWKPPLNKLPDQVQTTTADSGETVEIIRLDLSLPMGTGATIDDYIEEEPVVFDLAYIRAFTRTEPSRLRLARGVGDSMWPTLQSYDQVWIDSTQTRLNQSDRIWAVSINGGAAIKRLRPVKGGARILVISDNPGPGHENYEVDADEVVIGGRVIRFARDL